MSERARRTALFFGLVSPLVIAAVLFTLQGEDEAPSPAGPSSREAGVRGREGNNPVAKEVAALAAKARERSRLERGQQLASEDGAIPDEVLEREAKVLALAEPIARRFFSALARYELGESSAEIERAFAQTAARDLARELRGSPPRLPAGSSPLEAALAGDLQLLAVGGTRTRGLTEIELVGEIERAGERTPIAFEMERAEGRWLVFGLGR